MTLAHERGGDGEPLLLLHGLGSLRQVWDPVVPTLRHAHDVVAVDLPGFGESPVLPVGIEPSPQALAEAVTDFLDELGWDRPHVAGNSLGGWVALELAKRGRARSVGLLSPAGFWRAPGRAWTRVSLRATHASARRFETRAPRLYRSPVARTLGGWQMSARPWRMPPDDAIRGVLGLARAPGFDATLRAASARRFAGPVPGDVAVTIAWGERDRLLPFRQAARAARMLPGARSVTLTDCGHVPFWDDPDQVARVLLEASAGSAPAGR